MKTEHKIIIGLVIILTMAVSYIGYGEYKEKQLERDIFMVDDAILRVMRTIWLQTDDCNIMGMTIGNQSRSLVDVGCLE